MNGLPWDFAESERQFYEASLRQEATENAMRDAYREFGRAQEAYARKLADTITELRSLSVPVTVCLELAKGTEEVAHLRMKRDVADGVKEAAQQAAWRANADRRAVERLAGWSERREFAEAAGEVRHQFEKPIGGRA